MASAAEPTSRCTRIQHTHARAHTHTHYFRESDALRSFEMISPFEAKVRTAPKLNFMNPINVLSLLLVQVRMLVGAVLAVASLVLFWTNSSASAGKLSPLPWRAATLLSAFMRVCLTMRRRARGAAGRRNYGLPHGGRPPAFMLMLLCGCGCDAAAGPAQPMRLHSARIVES